MPARQFFALLKSSRELANEQRWQFMAEMCSVAAIPMCNTEYYKEVEGYFIAKLIGGNYKRGGVVQMSYDDPKAPKILDDIFKQKGRLDGHG